MRKKENTKQFTMCAMFMALTICLSSFGIPVPGGHFYLNDLVIVTGALLMDPPYALLAGGLGAFLGDALFYQPPMFVSLVTHGLQAYVISKMIRSFQTPDLKKGILAVLTGAIIMVSGYTIGRAFIYATREAALLKLPFQILQALLGGAIALFLVYFTPIKKTYEDSIRS